MKSLQNLKVLVTRPIHQAQSLCALLENEGAIPIIFPTLEIAETKDKNILHTAIGQLNDFDIAIFTSVNAVLHTLPHWPKKTFEKLQIAAIGPATAQALKNKNLWVDILPEHSFSSEALLALPLFQYIQNKKIVIFTGEKGRTLLAETLSGRHAKVTCVPTYRRVCPSADLAKILHKQPFDMMISTSLESLKNLIALAANMERSLFLSRPLVVISQRMATYAKNSGFSKVILANNASDKAIFDALKAWYS